MTDLSWLAHEAKSIHAIFQSLFFAIAGTLLLLGVVLEYFRFPLGGAPQFSQLVGRTLVATLLLTTYPDVSNLIAEVTDALANRVGELNAIPRVLARFGDKIHGLSWSWTAFKDSVLMLISFATFFLLYISVYIANAAIAYAWVLLYVFSPLLIALFILPITAGVTKTLYRSLLEVGAWKVVWSVLAALLWSTAMGQINESGAQINFITAISLNLILAGSLLLTPLVVNALVGAGIAHVASQMAGIAVGAASLSPGQILNTATKKGPSTAASWVGSQGARFVQKYREAHSGGGEKNSLAKASASLRARRRTDVTPTSSKRSQKASDTQSAPTQSPKSADADRLQPPVTPSQSPKVDG